MTTDIQLTKLAQTRINRLAQAAGRSPASMLRFVLRDGFEAVENSIKENAIADAEFEAGNFVTHADVMRDASHIVGKAKPRTSSAA